LGKPDLVDRCHNRLILGHFWSLAPISAFNGTGNYQGHIRESTGEEQGKTEKSLNASRSGAYDLHEAPMSHACLSP